MIEWRERLTRAFAEGPEPAWQAAQQLLEWAADVVNDLGRARFRVNFGTERCGGCTGLKAGPGVAATCFQVQACHFQHVRADGLNPNQARMLDLLGKDPDPRIL